VKTVDAATIDAIGEIVNIGVGKAAGQLNQMTGSHIILKVPSITLIPFGEITSIKNDIFSESVRSAVILSFKGSFSGITAIVFPPESAASLVTLLTGETESSADLDPMRVEALKEVGNIIINAVMGSIANVLSEHLTYSVPTYYEGPISDVTELRKKQGSDEWVLMAHTNFQVESLNIDGNILLVLEIGSLDNLVQSIQRVYSN
jgi:chemotaxis protein CheC